MTSFRVYLRSAPGMWERYAGHVDVTCERAEEAFAAAVRRLARSSFPDRPSLDSWRLERVEYRP